MQSVCGTKICQRYGANATQTFITTYDLVRRVYEDMDDDQDMITPLQFGQLFLDWTDYTKVIAAPGMMDEVVDGHAILAFDIIRALYDDERTGMC